MDQPFVVHTPLLLKVADLNPVGYNPRKISAEKFEALKENIVAEGFVEPIVVQKTGLRIIGGHQRVRAAKELSIEAGIAPPDLPCVVLDIDDPRAKKLNIKLNNLKGEFEARMLGELLVDLYDDRPIEPADALGLGFSYEEANKYIHLIEPDLAPPDAGDPSVPSFGRNPTLSLEFTDAAMRDLVRKLLTERVAVEKKKTGDLVADALGVGRKAGGRKKRAAA